MACFIFLGNFLNAATNNKNFILLTSLYNEDNPTRADEYIYCLNRNIKHHSIKTIHVVYDTLNDVSNKKNKILDYLISNPIIKISYCKGRPTYDFLFNLANEFYPNEKIILSNADIYFDETLSSLENYDLTSKFLSLTRWDLCGDNELRPCFTDRAISGINHYGADSWIFSTPIIPFKDLQFGIGTSGCDGRLIYQAYKSNIKLLNPCKDIRSCHVHRSQIRHYNREEPKYNMAWIRAGRLTDKNAEVVILKEYKEASGGELRIVCTAALLDHQFDMRKKEYIKSLNTLANYGFKENVYVVEAIKGVGPTFLDQHSKNVFYSKAHDFNVKDIRNKGINEARTLLDGLDYFNFHPNDMILKLTGRYRLKSNKFIKLIKQNPDVDIFVKVIHNGDWPITGCFAMRYRYMRDLLENLDYRYMEENFVYIEHKVMEYINKMFKNKTAKIMFVENLDLSANIFGRGKYSQTDL